jgi:hypothetical protein
MEHVLSTKGHVQIAPPMSEHQMERVLPRVPHVLIHTVHVWTSVHVDLNTQLPTSQINKTQVLDTE